MTAVLREVPRIVGPEEADVKETDALIDALVKKKGKLRAVAIIGLQTDLDTEGGLVIHNAWNIPARDDFAMMGALEYLKSSLLTNRTFEDDPLPE